MLDYDVIDERLEWGWAGENPDHWQGYFSELEAGPYNQSFDCPGADRFIAPPDGEGWYYIVGEDAGLNPVTDPSNQTEVII